jgi:hypothetical protein
MPCCCDSILLQRSGQWRKNIPSSASSCSAHNLARYSVGKQPVTLQVEIIEVFYPNVLKATDHNIVALCKVDGVGNSKNLCCLLPGFSRSGING